MNCTNVHIQERLGDYLTGHLDPADRAEVACHLAECDNCRQSLQFMEKLAGFEAGSIIHHPDFALITRFYAEPETLDEATIEAFKKHLQECDECAYELDFLRDMEAGLEKSAAARGERQPLLEIVGEFLTGLVRKPALAYFLLLLTIYPTYLWLSGTGEPGAGGGYVSDSVFQLSNVTRTAGDLPVITPDADKPIVVLNLPFRPFEIDYTYSASIADIEMTSPLDIPIILDMRDSTSINALLDLRDMASGSYVLILHEQSRDDPEDFEELLFPFTLETK